MNMNRNIADSNAFEASSGSMGSEAEAARQEAAPSLAQVFASFFRLGLTAFGGPAMLPYIRAMVVEKRKWLAEEQFKLGMAICQLIPGATMMQVCAYSGLRLRGLPGAVTAYAAFGAPAFLLITALSAVYFRYRDIALVSSVFAGLQVVVLAIVAIAAVDFTRRYCMDKTGLAIASASAILFLAGVSPILVILAAALVGSVVVRETPAPRVPGGNAVRGFSGAAGLLIAAGMAILALFAVDKTLGYLALAMGKVDLFAFGAYGAYPVMLHEIVEVRNWMDQKTFLDGIALGQVTPGPILLTSAFVGYHLSGVLGALVGSVAVFTPSLVVLFLAVPVSDRLLGSQGFRRALACVLSTLGGLLAATCLSLATAIAWTPLKVVLALAALAALVRKVDILWVVLGGAIASLVLFQ